MAKQQLLPGIYADDSRNAGYLGNISKKEWVDGVKRALELLVRPPSTTSRAILDGIAAGGKAVTIIPSSHPGWGPDKIQANAGAVGDDPKTATAPGKPSEARPVQIGVGGGSTATLELTAQDWEFPGASASFKAVDEVVLHELVHALRQTLGQEDDTTLIAPLPECRLPEVSVSTMMSGGAPPPSSITQVYDTIEELAAILITNIYRSENQRVGLVRDHLDPRPRRGEPQGTAAQPFRDPREETRTLGWPLTKPRNFLTLWRPQIERLYGELSKFSIVPKIEKVRCNFNPFWELYVKRMRPAAATNAR